MALGALFISACGQRFPPADPKKCPAPVSQVTVARIVADTLRSLGLRYPEPDDDERRHFAEMRRVLESD